MRSGMKDGAVWKMCGRYDDRFAGGRVVVDASHLYGDDGTGHVWDGPVVVIHSAELHTCSRCGCDPSDDAAMLLCEPGERDNAET